MNARTVTRSFGAPLKKGVDASLITDQLSMAFDDNFDVAILITEDADFALQ